MWKQITFLEFVEYRKHYNVWVGSGSLVGGGDFGEWGKTKFNASIRWESDKRGARWYKFSYER